MSNFWKALASALRAAWANGWDRYKSVLQDQRWAANDEMPF